MVDAPAADDLPLLPADAVPVQPSIAEQQRAHAALQDGTDDSLPLAPAPPTSIMDKGWKVAGQELLDAGTRGLGLGTRATLEGLGGIVGGAGDVMTWPGRAIGRAIGYQPPPGSDFYTPPSAQIQSLIDSTGLPTAQSPTEANTSTVVRGAASAVPALTTGAGAGDAARVLLQGGAAALASEKAAGSDFVPPWAKPTVALVAGMFGAKGADAGAKLVGKTANAVAGNMTPTYQAFQRAGVDPTLVGTVSDSDLAKSLEAGLTRTPFASSVVRPVQEQAIQQFGNSVERTASQLDPAGVGTTPQRTGEVLQTAARDWRDNVFPARQAQAWQPVNQRMAGASVDPTEFRTALEYAASPPGLASLPETQRAWASQQARRWLDALNADIGTNGNLSWEQAQAIRTRIGDAMGTPDIVAGLGNQQLRGIYGGLARGMQNTAVAHGQGAPFAAANAVTTEGHAFIDNTLTKIIRANNPLQESVTPEQATNGILQGNDTHMQAVRDQLPAAADVLAAYKLRQASTAKPSVATEYDDTSTGTYLSNMNRMRQTTPAGYDALFNAPAVRQQLDDLSTVAGRLRGTQRHLNTSGTAEQLAWLEYARAVGGAEGWFGKAATAAAIPAFGNAGARIMTNPGVARFAGAAVPSPLPVPPRVIGLLGSSGR